MAIHQNETVRRTAFVTLSVTWLYSGLLKINR